MSDIDRYNLTPALAHAAEAACSYYLTDGFCGPRNCQQCKCWDQARAVMDATGLSARAVGFIFKHRNRIEDAAEQEETRIYQGVPWWSKPERIAAESKLASTERPEGRSNLPNADAKGASPDVRNKALEEAAEHLERHAAWCREQQILRTGYAPDLWELLACDAIRNAKSIRALKSPEQGGGL